MAPVGKLNFQQQETLVLEAAIKCIERTSLLDFTMASIAKEAGLSIGSIYKHIQSKEDVLVAIATRMLAQRQSVFAEVMCLPLTTPERLVCTVLIPPQKLNVYSFGVHLDMLTGNEAVLQRASSRWLENMIRVDQSIAAVFEDVLMQSCKAGELKVKEQDRERALELLSVGVWSISVGFTQVVYQRQARRLVDISSELPFPLASDHALVKNVQQLLNIHPWETPLDAAGIEKACVLLEARGLR